MAVKDKAYYYWHQCLRCRYVFVSTERKEFHEGFNVQDFVLKIDMESWDDQYDLYRTQHGWSSVYLYSAAACRAFQLWQPIFTYNFDDVDKQDRPIEH